MLVQEAPKLIGNVAKSSGVPIKTIRYYEELGLLRSLGRTEGGFRLFNSDVLARLNFIKRAQSLGLTLSEIKDFLNVHDGGELPCVHIKAKLQDKITAIDEQIQQLLILRQELSGLVSGWETIPENPEQTICPIIERN
ncbi:MULTISPECIES: heavy metal-responsive transcriptional regulator [Nostoc]|uniref:Heavy metal-responsive transcriptional regulator n=2 Tax=Nostoc TaxID=1177 RepID=A0ABR8IBJ4_9NOSO|nr:MULTISPECIES: heavy metal-responsive transcriptional regulator [Nostoc]MBD2560644.1 heavy metal-responsive transcriptional regulator [Nostoc linckia FACHB-391]MBD2648259.1 heavy metal-responsive transcriptional regulator [Nostoc foliaceum FACHB-393]